MQVVKRLFSSVRKLKERIHSLESEINIFFNFFSSRILLLLYATNTLLGGKSCPLGLDNSLLSFPDGLRNSHGRRAALMAEGIGFLKENGRIERREP